MPDTQFAHSFQEQPCLCLLPQTLEAVHLLLDQVPGLFIAPLFCWCLQLWHWKQNCVKVFCCLQEIAGALESAISGGEEVKLEGNAVSKLNVLLAPSDALATCLRR